MKRNSLTTALVAGIAGTVGIANLANAVNLNPDGLGQVLIYPYYTVNTSGAGSDINTLFSVVNTTGQGKAVKVRFREGYNSREVLDFNLYLSPYDVWTGVLFSLPDQDQGNLLTDDNSCTVPAIKNANVGGRIGALPDGRKYVKFDNSRFTGSYKDGGPQGLTRTREGYFEMIEMGVVTNASKGSLTAITHSAGKPKNCQQVINAWVAQPQGYWIENPGYDMDPPSGGLFGSVLLIDVANGVNSSYSPDAIDGFSAIEQHSEPRDEFPTTADVNDAAVGVGAAQATAYVFNNGKLIQATYGQGIPGTRKIDAVSALFMSDNIFNTYEQNTAAGIDTDWTVTFPTKWYYVDNRVVGNTALPPFVEVFNGESAVEVGLFPYDREEGSPGACTGSDADNPNCGVCFSPCDVGGPNVPVLRYETQVITFKRAADFDDNSTSSVLGSQLTDNIDVGADSLTQGWLRISLNPITEPHALPASSSGDVFNGLPVTGFAVTNFVNANVGGNKIANYAGLWRHKASRNCTATTGACS